MYQWQRDHEDVTGHLYGCVGITEAERDLPPEVLPWPVMVNLEIEAGAILADDARAFGLLLLAAAEVADQANARISDELRQVPTLPRAEISEREREPQMTVDDVLADIEGSAA